MVYRVEVETSWHSPGNSGDLSFWTKPRRQVFFVEACTPEQALKLSRGRRGCQDDQFDIVSMNAIAGDCSVIPCPLREDQ